jgi:ethanolamine utilization cobalamin adenosyltransferase
MATILVKGLSEELLKELKRLKVELNCKTWAELLAKLVESKSLVILSEEDLKRMRKGAREFLKLKEAVSKSWRGPPTVLEEVRRSRSHENA